MTRLGGDSDSAALQIELQECRRLLEQLTGEAHTNERKWERMLERQEEILRASTLAQLLSVLTAGFKRSFGLEAVRLLIDDPAHEIRHLLEAGDSRLEDPAAVRFVDSLIGLSPQFVSLRRVWLGGYMSADHGLLFADGRSLRSLAFLPLRRHEKLVGVLCFGSADEQRFHRRLNTSFFQHLASIATIAFENACNRERVVQSSLSDYLTGWRNRRYLNVRLREELARARRLGTEVSCLMVDVDHFKIVNDLHGHAVGDAVLREVASRIEAKIRESDTAVRFGGDEFVLLLPDASMDGAVRLAERIERAVEPPLALAGLPSFKVTVSIGAAALRVSREAADLRDLAERLLMAADEALYDAKQAGRACVRSRHVTL